MKYAFEVIFIIACVVGLTWTIIFDIGKQNGYRKYHKGLVQCTTLPDNRVECWEVKQTIKE